MTDKQKLFCSYIIRGYIPTLMGILYLGMDKPHVDLYLVKVMLLSLVISIGVFILSTIGVLVVHTCIDFVKENGFVSIFVLLVILALASTRLHGYPGDNIIPSLIKFYGASLIFYLIDIKLLGIDFKQR